MFTFDQLRYLHLEITNRCQASCPMCSRNINGGLENPRLKLSDWTFDEFKQIVTPEVLNQIEVLTFCGSLGDPSNNNDLILICKYCTETNPNVVIAIATNGGARKKEWWGELARALPAGHAVDFGIDGLEDTHHLYRIGTNYENVITNAREFINAGGRANWDFIKFKHNEHQVDEAYRRAKELGFENFNVKDTRRFSTGSKFPVLDRQGNIINYLEPPSNSNMHYLSKDIIDNFKEIVKNTQIECEVLKTKALYIDAFKKVFPCNHLAAIPFFQYTDENVLREVNNQYAELLEKLKTNDALTMSIKDIINRDEWQCIWNEYWYGENKMVKCAESCGKFNNFSADTDQYVDLRKIDNKSTS